MFMAFANTNFPSRLICDKAKKNYFEFNNQQQFFATFSSEFNEIQQ